MEPDATECHTVASKWKKLSPQWRLRFPWLVLREDGAALGCSVCNERFLAVGQSSLKAASSNEAKFARLDVCSPSSLQPSTFQKHAISKWHQSCAAGHDMPEALAPSEQEYLDVVQKFKSGSTATDDAQGKKFRKMIICLAEGQRQYLRERIAMAETMSLQQDARKDFLMIRFFAANSSLEQTSGVLGCAFLPDYYGFTSKALMQATSFACVICLHVLSRKRLKHRQTCHKTSTLNCNI